MLHLLESKFWKHFFKYWKVAFFKLFDVPAVATSDMMMVILLIMKIFEFVTKEIFTEIEFSCDAFFMKLFKSSPNWRCVAVFRTDLLINLVCWKRFFTFWKKSRIARINATSVYIRNTKTPPLGNNVGPKAPSFRLVWRESTISLLENYAWKL